MKTLKYIFLLALIIGTAGACLVDDDAESFEANENSPNVVTFNDAVTTMSAVTDGNVYTYSLKVKVVGPSAKSIASPVTATVTVDESSTAIEGTHFRIDNPTITLSPDDNLLGLFPVTILTEGIRAPLDVAPVIVLNVNEATGAAGVTNSAKKIAITINYGCFSDLAGTYSAVVTRTNFDGVVTTYDAYEDEIYKIGIGEYHTSFVGHYIPTNGGGLGVGTEGFSFSDVCDELSVPLQGLNDFYSNEVSGTEFGSVNIETGVLTLKYQITFAAGIRSYVSVYTPVP